MSYQKNKTDQEVLNEILQRPARDHYRAAGGNLQEGFGGSLTTGTQPNKDHPPADSINPDGVWTLHDKRFLDQYVMLNDGINVDEVYNYLTQQINDFSNGFKNYREFPETKKIVGYHFDESREGCYRVELFQFQEQMGINCTRLEGDALAVCKIWSLLKKALYADKFYTDDDAEYLDDGETDDEFYDSDDEEMDFDMNLFKYLDFSRDPAFVGRLIQEIEDINIGTHSLMLLAFNCESQKNLDFLSQHYGQEVFNKIIERFAENNGRSVTLPVVRASSHIICYMIAQATISVAAMQFQTILDTIQFWCVEQQRTQNTITPTASEEAAFKLTEILGSLHQAVPEQFDSTSQLRAILEQTDFDSVAENVDAFLTS